MAEHEDRPTEFKTQFTADPIAKYIADHSLRISHIQEKLLEVSESHPLGYLVSDPLQIQLLQMVCKMIGAKKALDIGVFTGYSAVSIAMALPEDGHVIACDITDEYINIGKPLWKEAGVNHKIDVRIAPASDTLKKLIDDGQSGTFDFAFIDADKENNELYYELCLKLVRQGGVIAFDNTLWYGKVVDETRTDQETEAIRACNKLLSTDERIDISFIKVGDGTTLCRKK